MGRGRFPGGMPGGMNINKLMKQAKKIETDMKKSQEEIQQKSFEATSGGSAVKVVMTGDRKITDFEIDEDLIQSNDKEMIEDLVKICMNDVLKQIDDAEKEMTSGFNIPGIGL